MGSGWTRGACAALLVLLSGGTAAAERGAARWAVTGGFCRSLDFHDGQGRVRRTRMVDGSGASSEVPVDVGRLQLDAELALTEYVTLRSALPFLVVRPFGPVGGREALGDVTFGASVALAGGRVKPWLEVRLPTGVDVPGAAPPAGSGRRALTGDGVTAVAAGAALEAPLGPLRGTVRLSASAAPPARVRYLSHPDAFDEPDYNAELVSGPRLEAAGRLDWTAGRWLALAVEVGGRAWGRTGVRRARRVELLDDRGTADPADDVARSVLAGPDLEWLTGSDGWLLRVTPTLSVPAAGVSVEADLLLAGRGTRPLHVERAPGTGVYDREALGAEENARWPLDRTGVRILGDLLLGEVRVRAEF